MTTTHTTTESSAAAEDVVRKVYEAFTSTDAEVIEAMARSLFAADVVVREAESLPWGGRYEGLEDVTAMTVGLADPAAPIDAANLVVEHLVAEATNPGRPVQVIAVVTFPWRGTTTIPMRALEWFTVRDGLVIEIQVFLWDTAAAITALQ